MKKAFSLIIMFVLFACALYADNPNLAPEKDPAKWTNMTYVNIPILKILEAKEGYLIIYQKNKLGVGSTVIPKKWVKGTPENPRKLQLRNTKAENSSFMTVVKKDDSFHRVILTIPMSKKNSVWGVYSTSNKLEGTDKETLEELDL